MKQRPAAISRRLGEVTQQREEVSVLRYPTLSALNESINDKFNAAGIVIAFPQLDLHLDTIRPLRVHIEGGIQTN